MASEAAGKGQVPQAQKHVSGLLLASVILSLGGFVFLPVLGPIVALLLGWYGKRKVAADPLLIGPRFASVCIVVAAIALPVQGYFLYRQLPIMSFQDAVGKKVTSFRANFTSRDYEDLRAMMAEDWQKTHSVDDVKKTVESVFPGKDDLVVSDDGFKVKEEAIRDPDLRQRFDDFFRADYPATLGIELPLLVAPKDAGKADLVLKVRIEREAYLGFTAYLDGFTLKPVVEKEEPGAGAEGSAGQPAVGTGGSGAKPAVGTGGSGAKPAVGTGGSEGKPAVGTGGPGAKATESTPADDSR